MNGMIVGQFSTSYPSCKGPNTATHDQEVDENQATEDTQQETIDCVITKEGEWDEDTHWALHYHFFILDILKLLKERGFTGVTLGTSQINSLYCFLSDYSGKFGVQPLILNNKQIETV